MTKSAVSDWDATAANNLDVGGISLAENVMRPPAVNNALREVMAQVKTFSLTVVSELGAYIHALTAKTTLVDADEIGISDSAASNVGKKITWANFKLAAFASPALTGNPTAPTATTGDNDTSIATTAFVADAVKKRVESLVIAVGDETTALVTGTAKVTFRNPYATAFVVTGVKSSVTVASTSGLPTVDIKEGGVSIFSTLLTIDANELTSTTAATAAVVSDASLAADASITIDVTVAGTGTKGLKVYLLGYAS